MWYRFFVLVLFLHASLISQKEPDTYDAQVNAYIYGFPLVLMDVTKQVFTHVSHPTHTQAPVNQFLHAKTFPDANFKSVVSPNVDTLYSIAWLDLSQEPMILSVPAMGSRYYVLELLDGWTNVITSVGTRTTHNRKGHFAIVGPFWKGTLPQEIERIDSPTNMVWLIGRTATAGSQDFEAVHAIQKQYILIPLHAWGKEFHPPQVAVHSTVEMHMPPLEQVLHMSPENFFKRLSILLKDNPPAPADTRAVKELATLGITPGKEWNTTNLKPEHIQSLKQAVQEAQKKIKAGWSAQQFTRLENNWIVPKDIGRYGTEYQLRAVIAYGALGANAPEDAIYARTQVDSQDKPLQGIYAYRLHFNKEQLPPVEAFWSLTLYNEHQFFYPNALHRYALRDKDPLHFNPDGSLDLYIQHTSPGIDKEANWLPSPREHFNLMLRMYQPKDAILTGDWKPPAIERIH